MIAHLEGDVTTAHVEAVDGLVVASGNGGVAKTCIGRGYGGEEGGPAGLEGAISVEGFVGSGAVVVKISSSCFNCGRTEEDNDKEEE